MASLLIIADDLTGAVEAGGLLAGHGVSTVVVHDFTADLSAVLKSHEHTAVVFNTESRHISTEEAARRVEKAIRMAKTAGIGFFFKKTDSTMRGNVGAELQAFMHSAGCRRLPFVPAHPVVKRFTRQGHHFIGDVLLHRTSFAHDPLHPVLSSYIPDMKNMQTGVPVHAVSIDNVGSSATLNGILVYDCEHLKDLHTIGGALKDSSLHHIMAGSSAMVDLLPELLQLTRTLVKSEAPAPPALLVSGSVNRISIAQVAYARKAGIKTITIPQQLLAIDEGTDWIPARDLPRQIEQAAATEDMVVLTSLNPETSGPKGFSQQSAREASESIGRLVHMCMQEVPFRTLVVFGGDTLLAVMRAMGCTSILPTAELLPGVSNAVARTGRRDISLITKPGGYGDEDIVLEIQKQLQQ